MPSPKKSQPRKMGRPLISDAPLKKVTVRLSDSEVSRALDLSAAETGRRELSTGVRAAIRIATKRRKS